MQGTWFSLFTLNNAAILKTMLLTVGELRAWIIAEMKKESDGSYTIDGDDLNSALGDRSNPWSKVGGTDFYVPLRYREKFSMGPGDFTNDRNRIDALKRLKLTPKDVLSVLKHSPTTVKGVTLNVLPRARTAVFGRMANRIATAHADDVDVVTYPESGSTMARELAELVADKLGGLPVVTGSVLKKQAAELEIDEPSFEEFRSRSLKRGESPSYIEDTRANVEKSLATWRRKNTRPETKKIPHAWRQFLNLHKVGNAGPVLGKRVLVVDDNVDKGETLGGIEKLLKQAGAREVHLAAGWDFSDRGND